MNCRTQPLDFFSTFPFPLLKSSRSYRGVRNCFRDFWELIWWLFKPTGTCSNSVLRCYGCSALKAKSRKSRWTLVQSDWKRSPLASHPRNFSCIASLRHLEPQPLDRIYVRAGSCTALLLQHKPGEKGPSDSATRFKKTRLLFCLYASSHFIHADHPDDSRSRFWR